MDPDRVTTTLSPISCNFVKFKDTNAGGEVELTVVDCWRALYRSKTLGWLDFSDHPSLSSIDMEEHLHYDAVANGQLHVVVPSKLLAFRCPTDLPDGRVWMDEGVGRQFSASYYAEVLGDFDVSVVVNCGRPGTGYDADPLEAAGVSVEVVSTNGYGGGRLRAVDRLLTLAWAAPGAVAVHGSGAGEEEVLLAAYLIRLHGFEAQEAVAWVRMAHPSVRTVVGPILTRHETQQSDLENLFVGPGAAGPGDEVTAALIL
jgi:hypothetical protein